jgi:hypothetical protein
MRTLATLVLFTSKILLGVSYDELKIGDKVKVNFKLSLMPAQHAKYFPPKLSGLKIIPINGFFEVEDIKYPENKKHLAPYFFSKAFDDSGDFIFKGWIDAGLLINKNLILEDDKIFSSTELEVKYEPLIEESNNSKNAPIYKLVPGDVISFSSSIAFYPEKNPNNEPTKDSVIKRTNGGGVLEIFRTIILPSTPKDLPFYFCHLRDINRTFIDMGWVYSDFLKNLNTEYAEKPKYEGNVMIFHESSSKKTEAEKVNIKDLVNAYNEFSSGDWLYDGDRSLLDDSPTVWASLKYHKKKPESSKLESSLVVRLKGGRIQAYFTFNDFMGSRDILNFPIKFDSSEVTTLRGSFSTDGKAVFINSSEFLDDLINSDQLITRFNPYLDNSTEIVFSTKGLQKFWK